AHAELPGRRHRHDGLAARGAGGRDGHRVLREPAGRGAGGRPRPPQNAGPRGRPGAETPIRIRSARAPERKSAMGSTM
ncbi:MAG: hypothetical protein AVDCRST_MAG83-3373, partial [uncultured Arthrobacter sp.]